MKRVAIETVGWYGMVAILVAYMLISFGFLKATQAPYQLISGTGSIGILLNASYHRAWPSVALNCLWTLIATIVLIKIVMF
jgi:hypothetical protein